MLILIFCFFIIIIYYYLLILFCFVVFYFTLFHSIFYCFFFQGSGGHASSGTTHPPSFVAVAARGEWSIGKVLDVYFKFGMGGDQYLGRILALLDPNKPEFSMLPPHWKDSSLPIVKKGLKLCFARILRNHANTDHDPTGILTLLLASIVYHADFMNKTRMNNPAHPFGKIPILNDHEPLAALREEVTLEANDEIPCPTGIPPHIEQAARLRELLEVTTTVKNLVQDFKNHLDTSVASAIDKKVAGEGGINMGVLQKALDKLKEDIMEKMKTGAGENDIFFENNGTADLLPALLPADFAIEPAGKYMYKFRFWDVPESFCFPQEVTRIQGWRMWLKGYIFASPAPERKMYKIKPFRHFGTPDFESESLKKDFKNKWNPIFKKMMETPGLNVPARASEITDAFVEESFDRATEFLEDSFSFLFTEVNREKTRAWTIGTWSRKISPSEVRKHGTAADKAKLPEATARNQPHRNNRCKRTITEKRGVHKVAKRRKRACHRARTATVSDGGENSDEASYNSWFDNNGRIV